MILPLLAAGLFTLVTLVLALLVSGLMWLRRRAQRRYWRRVLWLHLVLFVLHLFVTFPVVLGGFVSRGIGTRGDERGYQGPRLDAEGRLQIQTKATLRAESVKGVGGPTAGSPVSRHLIASRGGEVTIRAFCVPARGERRVVAVMVHGLFRSSMELEPVAAMLRERGVECWLMDQCNHGGSSHAPFTGGLRESDDVVAVVRYVRAQPARADLPLMLYGVSLGTISVSLALPHLDGVAGVVLDAPIDDLTAAAHRMMTFHRPGDRRNFTYLYEPFRSLLLTSLGLWSGFATTDVVPIEVLASTPPDLPFLIVGEGRDDRAPPASVRALFDRLPQHEGTKELFEVPHAGHGKAFLELPAAYDAALGRLLQRLHR